MMNKVSCSAARFINISHIDVLIVPLWLSTFGNVALPPLN